LVFIFALQSTQFEREGHENSIELAHFAAKLKWFLTMLEVGKAV
jgi:hypothetical protein